jgi:hypothetical protein
MLSECLHDSQKHEHTHQQEHCSRDEAWRQTPDGLP